MCRAYVKSISYQNKFALSTT